MLKGSREAKRGFESPFWPHSEKYLVTLLSWVLFGGTEDIMGIKADRSQPPADLIF